MWILGVIPRIKRFYNCQTCRLFSYAFLFEILACTIDDLLRQIIGKLPDRQLLSRSPEFT